MPQKKIVIPSPIQFTDPATGQLVPPPDGVLDFVTFIGKLNANPLWNETWQAGLAQRSITKALAEVKDDVLLLSEEDWKFLDQAAKNPRMMVFGAGGASGVVPGLGLHPSLAGQVVPFQLAIIQAETV